MYTKHFYGCF